MTLGSIEKNSIICGHCKWIKNAGDRWACDNPDSSFFECIISYSADGCEVFELYRRINRNTNIALELLKGVQQFIDREWIGNADFGHSAGGYGPLSNSYQKSTYYDEDFMLPAEPDIQEDKSLSKKGIDDIFSGLGQTFQEKLLSTIDAKGMTDAQVYTKANLDRRLFSKIRCNKNYKPSKSTVLALAIALNLNLDDTTDLLQRAGLALSPSSKADLIVEYCILNGIYDILDVNAILYEYDQQLLGY